MAVNDDDDRDVDFTFYPNAFQIADFLIPSNILVYIT